MITSTEKIGNRMVIRVLKNIDDLKTGEDFKINSHGIGKILMFYRRFKGIGGKIYVAPLNDSIREIFEPLMLDKLIPEIKL